jgi:hypothetical protein
MDIFEEVRSFVGDNENNGSNTIAEFPLLSKNAVESLRYRAEVSYHSPYSQQKYQSFINASTNEVLFE